MKSSSPVWGTGLPQRDASLRASFGLAEQGRCNYCHVEDLASDEKMQKLIAREMIKMVREINGSFGDGKAHVSCYTCHRRSLVQAMAP